MMEFFVSGGFMMYPLLISFFLVVGFAAWSAVRMRRSRGPDPVLETRIDATLFWGGWAFVIGLLGTFVGIYVAAGAIERAGDVGAGLVWGGIKVALTTTLFGLLILTLAGLLWFGLRAWYRRERVSA